MSLTISVDEIVAKSRDGRLADGPGWGRVRLSEVARIQNGFAFKSERFNKQGRGRPLLRIRDVGDDETEAYYDGEYEDRYVVSKGDLVVGMDGDFRVALWRGPSALLNQRVARITLKDEARYDARFLLHALPAYLDAIKAATSSVTVKHLSSRTLEDVPLPNPPVEEQQLIVAAIEEQFSRLDAAGGLLSRSLVRTSQLEAALTASLFLDGWPRKPLEELADPERPVCYGILKPRTTGHLTVPYVEVRSIVNGRIDVDSLSKTTEELHKLFIRSELQPGDVLLAIRGSYDRSAVVPSSLKGANVSRDVARIAPTRLLDSTFLAVYQRSPRALNFFRRVARGVAVKGVNIGDLRRMPVPVPDRSEQEEVVSRYEREMTLVHAISDEVRTGSRRIGSLRAAVLRDAFSGQLSRQVRMRATPSEVSV